MNLEAVKHAASLNEWSGLIPEIALGCLALLLLVVEMVLPKKRHDLIATIAIIGQFGILGWVAWDFHSPFLGRNDAFSGLLQFSYVGQAMRVFFLLSSIFVSILARVSLAKQQLPRIEFYHIVLVATAAMMLLAQANHFVLFFVALETLTVGLYILVSYFRTSPLSLEAGLKYLIMGALSSSLLLFGIVLLYGVAGNPALEGHTADPMNFAALTRFLALNPDNFLAAAGIVLVLSGIAFKIGAFPFQIWIPDVYQGAPTPTTAFLAVSSKAAGFAILLVLVNSVFGPYWWLVQPVLVAMAVATILFGNIAALTQHNVKRLIGLSGVSHAGFLLIGIIASHSVPSAVGAVLFYLFAYLLATFAVFGVMAHLAGADDAEQELDHYAGLAKEDPFLAAILAVALGSLAGIPPLAGFMGKLFVFIAAFKAGFYGLLAVAIVGVVISIYYYFGWIKAAFFETWTPPADAVNPRPARTPVGAAAGVALATLALCSILFGVYQGPLGAWLLAR
ncbi:NADH-quinone oxidoreductase subunit N [Opitutus terrae]|uniref:NADH-quinone oxidoreductase subunit N 1 n=1 Tax=Opitutus terrae (strain DSM 11246 / JCM 15787 / PB90-1) TaxID=452637 RepID=NUON1_OPITP|nr:NADH-quinone oxidoreductase subunit N [Opitutus terrae]B1ZRS0.1 RecName: Full=NADH-quinone oxidoreductase subunit N 1; AltName: Full=NADH dehydrogenase I subunit N 1; AltName: Full=NDH-1 subunit N 1 [Opitutus terrae PB90-1]ACB73763.1 proton-translocating NADH-quinone oxidoreductase, chain N [Opitutus terrae PB90-1]